MVAVGILPLDLGAGLVLHASTVGDAEESYAIVDAERERLREWLPWVDGTRSAEDTIAYLRTVEAANADGTGLHATIRADGRLGGFVGLRVNPLHGSGEIGYWLAAHCVGRGVITRSVVAMFEIGFHALGLHRLELLAATGNTRSRAVAERLGMTLEGVRREAEELPSGYVDLAMYSVLVQDWAPPSL